MTRAQQVETILRLDAEAKTRNNQEDISVVFEEDLCSTSKEDMARIDTEDNSYTDSSTPAEHNDGVLDTFCAGLDAAFGAFMGASAYYAEQCMCCCFRG